ncbi:hypothetical protein YC2023_026045 [Brassica napus]
MDDSSVSESEVIRVTRKSFRVSLKDILSHGECGEIVTWWLIPSLSVCAVMGNTWKYLKQNSGLKGSCSSGSLLLKATPARDMSSCNQTRVL